MHIHYQRELLKSNSHPSVSDFFYHVFLVLLLSNGCLFLFQYSGIQLSCHNMKLQTSRPKMWSYAAFPNATSSKNLTWSRQGSNLSWHSELWHDQAQLYLWWTIQLVILPELFQFCSLYVTIISCWQMNVPFNTWSTNGILDIVISPQPLKNMITTMHYTL